MSKPGGAKAIVAAMSANLAIAAMKFIAWLLTGAASLLAEAIHSTADSANQILMLLGRKSAQRQADELHPFGYGRDRYISAFLVAVILFSMGGLFALYEAFRKFQEVRAGHPDELLESRFWWVSLVVLVGAIAAESFSLRTALAEAKPARGNLSLAAFIRQSRAPELPVVLLEDMAALLGLVFALVGVSVSLATGSGYGDVIGSGLIGLLLVAVAIVLAVEIKSLLVGESARPEQAAAIARAIVGVPDISGLVYLKTLHIGPESVLVAAKITAAPELDAVRLARAIDEAETAIRAAEPMVGPIFLEPDIWDGAKAGGPV
ncbi:MAG: cation diffusion facilitator family transporter [Propionibacteriaceae bacterium]|nr:cation diffusion facilitator family transporter [Propionibacteriaceae bacterium]